MDPVIHAGPLLGGGGTINDRQTSVGGCSPRKFRPLMFLQVFSGALGSFVADDFKDVISIKEKNGHI